MLAVTILVLTSYSNSHAIITNEQEDEVINPEQPLTSKPQTSSIVRAGDIYASCQHHFENHFNSRESISKRASCNGYFFGIGGILLILQNEKVKTKTCIPSDISAHNITKAFLKWAKDPKNDLNMSAPEATMIALREKFGCK